MKTMVFISILFLVSCGTTGHMAFYSFNFSKYEVEKEIMKVINRDSSYSLPPQWKGVDEGDIFERVYVYFKNQPEELYRIGFIYDSATWKKSSSCTLGLVSQNDGQTWRNESGLSKKEIERITMRFETEILSKISYRYTKSY